MESVKTMPPGGVLVLGCADESANTGVKADERAIAAQQVPVMIASTGSTSGDEDGRVWLTEAEGAQFISQIGDATRKMNYQVVKIGALFSRESIQVISDLLQQNKHLKTVIDVEPVFKSGPQSEVMTALIKYILPWVHILSATVSEVKALLDEAGIPVDYPKGIQDVQSMAKILRNLGPEYVIIKREFLDEEDSMSTLHYVLVGPEQPILETCHCENPQRLFGASYFIPPVIAAHLARGLGATEAVAAGFKFAQEMLQGGQYFS